jgi:hypothetical protein
VVAERLDNREEFSSGKGDSLRSGLPEWSSLSVKAR